MVLVTLGLRAFESHLVNSKLLGKAFVIDWEGSLLHVVNFASEGLPIRVFELVGISELD